MQIAEYFQGIEVHPACVYELLFPSMHNADISSLSRVRLSVPASNAMLHFLALIQILSGIHADFPPVT